MKFIKQTLARLDHQHRHDIEYNDLPEEERQLIEFMVPKNELKEWVKKENKGKFAEDEEFDEEKERKAVMKEFKNVLLNF